MKPSKGICEVADYLIAPYVGSMCKIIISGGEPIVVKITKAEASCEYVDRFDMYELKLRLTVDHVKPKILLGVTLDPNEIEMARDNIDVIARRITVAIERSIKILDRTPLSRTLYER